MPDYLTSVAVAEYAGLPVCPVCGAVKQAVMIDGNVMIVCKCFMEN